MAKVELRCVNFVVGYCCADEEAGSRTGGCGVIDLDSYGRETAVETKNGVQKRIDLSEFSHRQGGARRANI